MRHFDLQPNSAKKRGEEGGLIMKSTVSREFVGKAFHSSLSPAL